LCEPDTFVSMTRDIKNTKQHSESLLWNEVEQCFAISLHKVMFLQMVN